MLYETIDYLYSVLLFFFQAEDGIRDKLVTGVQTCALPIFLEDGFHVADERALPASQHGNRPQGRSRDHYLSHRKGRREDRKSVRVGKECRSRWSPYH